MLREGSAGSNTAADHIQIVDAAVAALPRAWRRNLMVTVDGAGFSHKLLEHLDALASRRGYTLVYSCGWELDAREKAAIGLVPGQTLRHRILHAAARLVRGGRRRRWKIAATWPWAQAITRAWQRICALPDTS